MPDDLDPIFDQLRSHAAFAGLTEPTLLRTEGTRRRRTRTAIGLTALTLVVTGALGAGVALGAGRGTALPTTSTPPGPSAPGSSAPVSPPPSPSQTPSGSPSTTAQPPPCTAADLVSPAFAGADGAMGSAFLTLTVTNGSPRDCTLRGTPTLWGVAGGRPVTLPQHAESANHDTVLLRAGRVAALTIRTVNGQPEGLQCHTVVRYDDLQLDLGSGARYHAGTALGITCGDAVVSDWDVSGPAPCTSANFPRPPTVSGVPGLVGYKIEFSNAGPDACTLNEVPEVRYTDQAGHSGTLTAGQQIGPALVLAPGQSADLLISIPNPPSPCTSQVSYRDLQLRAGPIERAIPGTLTFPCAGATLDGWGNS